MPVEQAVADGLRVVLVRKPGLPLAAWGVAVRSGSAHELPGEEGYAHFLEHMAFKGTAGSVPGELTRGLDSLGLVSNAATGPTQTCFHIDGLRETLAEGASLLGPAVAVPGLPADELSTERGVVLAEFDSGESDPSILLYEAMQRQLFAGHPLGRDILGTRDSVAAADAAGLRRFHDRNYVRDNATAVLVGDLAIDEAVAICGDALRGLPHGPAPSPLPDLPPLSGSEGHTPLPVPARNASLATRVPAALDTARDAARSALGCYLGGSLSSPLMYRLRDELGIVYGITAAGDRDGGEATFWVEWAARPENELRVREVVAEELRRVAAGDVDARLLAGTLLCLRVTRARVATSPRMLLMRAFQDLDVLGRVRDEEERAAAEDAVTAEGLAREAAELVGAPWAFHAVGPEA